MPNKVSLNVLDSSTIPKRQPSHLITYEQALEKAGSVSQPRGLHSLIDSIKSGDRVKLTIYDGKEITVLEEEGTATYAINAKRGLVLVVTPDNKVPIEVSLDKKAFKKALEHYHPTRNFFPREFYIEEVRNVDAVGIVGGKLFQIVVGPMDAYVELLKK